MDSGKAERQGTDAGKTDPSVSWLERVQNGSKAELGAALLQIHGEPLKQHEKW